MVLLNACALDILDIWRCRFFIDDKLQIAFDICGLPFMKEVDTEPACELAELTVDDLKRLVAELQGIDKLRLSVDQSTWQNSVTYPLQS